MIGVSKSLWRLSCEEKPDLKMTTQSTNHVLLIDAEFYCNDQTMETNHYQISDDTISRDKTLMAISEFDQFKKTLVENKIKVTTLDGNIGCPDNIFPNWAVTYSDKSIYIQHAWKNRRLEKSKDHMEFLEKTYRLDQDYTPYENEGLFLGHKQSGDGSNQSYYAHGNFCSLRFKTC